MKIGGYGLREHIRLLAPIFALLAAVWLIRLVLGALGAVSLARVASVTVAGSVAILLAVFLIHIRNFGGYANVVMASLLLTAWTQLLIVLAILFAVATGTENIYTAPEFSFQGDDPWHLRHMLGHLTVLLAVSTLTGAAVGCLLLWLLRKVVPPRPGNVGTGTTFP